MSFEHENAQQRSDQIAAFQQELALLTQQAVLTLSNEQTHAVTQYHQQLLSELAQQFDIDTNIEHKKLSKSIQISAFFATLAFTASMYFFLQLFIGRLGLSAQFLVAIALPLLFLVAAKIAFTHESSGYFARLFACLSFIGFVANLLLLGDIFNLASSTNVLLPWAIYAVLLAYVFRSKLLAASFALCFVFYLADKIGVLINQRDTSFANLEVFFLPLGLVLLLSLFKHSFAVLYRTVALHSFFIVLLVLSWAGGSSLLAWTHATVESFYQLFGLVASLLVLIIGIRHSIIDCTRTGTLFFIVFLYSKLFAWWWGAIPSYLFFLLIGLSAVLCLLVFQRIRKSLTQRQYT